MTVFESREYHYILRLFNNHYMMRKPYEKNEKIQKRGKVGRKRAFSPLNALSYRPRDTEQGEP